MSHLNAKPCKCESSGGGSSAIDQRVSNLQRQIQSLEHRLQLLAELTGDLHDLAPDNGGSSTRGLHATRASARAASSERSAKDHDTLGLRRRLTRIIGGVPSAANEFPECTLLEIETPDGRSQLCSGVLVGKRLILSAAHCGNARRITAHLKCATIDDIRDGRAESIPAKAFRVHPDYRSSNHPAINDIMLVILAQDSSVSPVDICETKDLITAREVTLVGFGSASLNANSSTAGVKRKVEVPMTSIRHAIGEDLDREEASYGFESDSEFVAGREGFDTCQGDSGGPVYVIEEATGNRVVAGLTSRYALTNGREPANICGSGGIYTRIDFHLPWITRTAKQLLKA